MPKDEDVLQLVSTRVGDQVIAPKEQTNSHIFLKLYHNSPGIFLQTLFAEFNRHSPSHCGRMCRLTMNGCRVTQLLPALWLDCNMRSLKALKLMFRNKYPCSFILPCTLQHSFFPLQRLFHVHSHDQTCIIPCPSHQGGATCQHTTQIVRIFL